RSGYSTVLASSINWLLEVKGPEPGGNIQL
ncbi:hypothetical protein DBR06_SOUSAS3410187, partial [Sousa chinensis]